MKQVYVLRHAPKDNETGELTEEGIEQAKNLRKKFPRFTIIVASDSPRTQETAFLLTGTRPAIDARVSFYQAPPDQSASILTQAPQHPLGFTGAYLDTQNIKENVIRKARGFITMINETLDKLEDGQKALIVSHDITMVPVKQLLDHQEIGMNNKSFEFLSGFIVDDKNNIRLFQL